MGKVEPLEPRRLLAYQLIDTLLPDMTGPQHASEFGAAVAVSEDFRAVGLPRAARDGLLPGLVTVYDAADQLIATIADPQPVDEGKFGEQVALNDDQLLVVKASGNRVAVFDLSSGQPVLKHDFTGNDPSERFGDSLAIFNSSLVVGASYSNVSDTQAGIAYVYDVSGNDPLLTHTLLNPSPTALDRFGEAVGISGTTVVVSAPDKHIGPDTSDSDVGEAYVFDISANMPMHTHTLDNPTPIQNDRFGRSLAIWDSTIVVGTQDDNTGANDAGSVYVFDINASPVLRHTINNPAPELDDKFGNDLAIFGNSLLVGTELDDSNATNVGKAYLFDISGAMAQLTFEILNPAPRGTDNFGSSVAMISDLILIGARYDTDGSVSNAGAVHVFDTSDQVPILMGSLENPSVAIGDAFGAAIDVDGNIAVVGARWEDTQFTSDGAVYVYDLSNVVDPLLGVLSSPTPAEREEFGTAVATSDGKVVVGAPATPVAGTVDVGRAYVYDVTSGTPVLLHTLENPDPDSNDLFGTSVAMSGSKVAIGTPNDPSRTSRVGSVYLFDLNGNLSAPAEINSPAASSDDEFGAEIDLDGSFLVVGVPLEGTDGITYVYSVAGSNPTLRHTIPHPDPPTSPFDFDTYGRTVAVDGFKIAVYDSDDVFIHDIGGANPTWTHTISRPSPYVSPLAAFGNAIDISDDTVIIGAHRHDTDQDEVGIATVFDISGPQAVLKEVLTNPTPAEDDAFGLTVAISGETVLVGTPEDDSQNLGQGAAYVYQKTSVFPGDFDGGGTLNCADINSLTTAISAQTNDPQFDLTGDGLVDLLDRDAWLAAAGSENIGFGVSYQLGDANLDASVDVSDFVIWNASKFTFESRWCAGDFNADGVVDTGDFNLWNRSKFTSAGQSASGSVFDLPALASRVSLPFTGTLDFTAVDRLAMRQRQELIDRVFAFEHEAQSADPFCPNQPPGD